MKLSITAPLIAAAVLLACSTTPTQAQVVAGPRPPPQPTQSVNLMYSNQANDELGADDAPFNTCFASQNTVKPYAYTTFAPKNATINFYKDTNCQDFAFGLVGYYNGNPGQARSFRWVGWTEDTIGELFTNPIPGQGEAALHPGGPAPSPTTAPATPPPPTEGGGGHPNNNNPPPVTTPNQETGHDSKSKASPTFFGGIVGALVMLSIGGLIYWKTMGKDKSEEKGKGSLLPYARGATREDGDDADILLTTHNRSHLNNNNNDDTFEIGDDEDEGDESSDEEDRRHVRRHSNTVDEDDDEEDMREQKPRMGQHDRYRDDDDHA